MVTLLQGSLELITSVFRCADEASAKAVYCPNRKWWSCRPSYQELNRVAKTVDPTHALRAPVFLSSLPRATPQYGDSRSLLRRPSDHRRRTIRMIGWVHSVHTPDRYHRPRLCHSRPSRVAKESYIRFAYGTRFFFYQFSAILFLTLTYEGWKTDETMHFLQLTYSPRVFCGILDIALELVMKERKWYTLARVERDSDLWFWKEKASRLENDIIQEVM